MTRSDKPRFEVDPERVDALIDHMQSHDFGDDSDRIRREAWRDQPSEPRDQTDDACLTCTVEALEAELSRLREAAREVLRADALAESGVDGADRAWDRARAFDRLRIALEREEQR